MTVRHRARASNWFLVALALILGPKSAQADAVDAMGQEYLAVFALELAEILLPAPTIVLREGSHFEARWQLVPWNLVFTDYSSHAVFAAPFLELDWVPELSMTRGLVGGRLGFALGGESGRAPGLEIHGDLAAAGRDGMAYGGGLGVCLGCTDGEFVTTLGAFVRSSPWDGARALEIGLDFHLSPGSFFYW